MEKNVLFYMKLRNTKNLVRREISMLKRAQVYTYEDAKDEGRKTRWEDHR